MSLFLFINLPYKKKLSNMITLGSEIILVIMYILLAMINFNNESFTPSMKQTIGWVVCLLLAATIFALIYEVFCKTMFYLEPQIDLSKMQKDETQEKMLNDKEKDYLRKKAEEFFDSLLPRLRERLNLDSDSDDDLYKNYESGDSENS
jgi:predicted membrane protein